MIVEYNRPATMEEALWLLQRTDPKTVPLGGGTYLSQAKVGDVAVVDLQALGLDEITMDGMTARIGATAKLQDIYEFEGLPVVLYKALYQERGANMRRMMTLAGFLVTADGRSPLLAGLHALNARIVFADGVSTGIDEWLPARQQQRQKLITRIEVPVNAGLRLETVSRAPTDRPILTVALAVWLSGEQRLVLGGWGENTRLAYQGAVLEEAIKAAESTLAEASDAWASAEYRKSAASAILRRFMQAGEE
ncbi:MAG TPA: hypothetical protein GYA06_04645 [Chloroflexi bacterium]|nr:hypothetical protein [Chloroflexota bacterium]